MHKAIYGRGLTVRGGAMLTGLLLTVRLAGGATMLWVENPQVGRLVGPVFEQALVNILTINTELADTNVCRRIGLEQAQPGTVLRAGGGDTPASLRDNALSCWFAVSLLAPGTAHNTLWAACARGPDGRLRLDRALPWWEWAAWLPAAWNHYAITGDRGFLTNAYDVAFSTLAELRESHFDAATGLFRGPGVLQTGLSGYPVPPAAGTDGEADVRDAPAALAILPLSGNCLAVLASRAAEQLAVSAGRTNEAAGFATATAALRGAVNRALWEPERGTYAYFLATEGATAGRTAPQQETAGLALALLSGVADAAQARGVLGRAQPLRMGMPLVAPGFERFGVEQPGRYNLMVWPAAQGLWGWAAARSGDAAVFAAEMLRLATLVNASQGTFMECYNGVNGRPEGGWQGGQECMAQPHQLLGAASFVRLALGGLFGVEFVPAGLRFAPVLPEGWRSAELKELMYRGMSLDIELTGVGSRVTGVQLDGKPQASAFIPGTLTGSHALRIVLQP